MSLLSTLAPVAGDLARVDALIRRRLDSDVALVRQVAEYLVSAGGKRLRPALLLLASGALGYRGENRFELAAVIEFIHTATLLHDDVVDASDLRRGRQTANAAFGNAAAVLVGDFLYSRAFQMMVGIGDMRVMEVLAEATNTIAGGEVMQLMGTHDPDVDEARYLEVIRRKTAKLFEAAARLGAVLAGRAGARGGPRRVRPARRHRVPADRRRARLQRRPGQEPGRRPGRGQAHPAAHLHHALRLAPSRPAWCARRCRAAGAATSRACWRRSAPAARSTTRAPRRSAKRRLRCARSAAAASDYKQSLLELASFSVTREVAARSPTVGA